MRRAGSRAWPYLFTAASFVISRAVYRFHYGIEFDASPVGFYVQYIDPWFFAHDFVRSILYLHHQAPLQNVLVGIPLRLWQPSQAFAVLNLLYVAMALTTVLALLHAMLRLGVDSLLASIMSSLYACSPTTVLYENWLFYHLPVTCCLILSVVALLRYYRRRTFGAGLMFFSLLAVAALFRSTLGPQFVVVVIAILLFRPPGSAAWGQSARATLLRAAALPLLVLVLNSAKPTWLIGYGYGEAMAWGNLVSKVYDRLPLAERQRLLRQKLVSPAAPIFCLGDMNAFAGLRIPHLPTGIPLLDMERVPAGRGNAHAIEYLLMARRYYKPDALYLLSHYPDVYLTSVERAFSHYTSAATVDMWLPTTANFARLASLIRSIDVYWLKRDTGQLWLLILGLPLLVAYGIWRVLRANARVYSERCTQVAVAYLLLGIAYVTAVTTLVSFGDFSRYRYDIDPFYLVILGLLSSAVLRTARQVLRCAARRLVALGV
jgi:uncharacterized membrane protein